VVLERGDVDYGRELVGHQLGHADRTPVELDGLGLVARQLGLEVVGIEVGRAALEADRLLLGLDAEPLEVVSEQEPLHLLPDDDVLVGNARQAHAVDHGAQHGLPRAVVGEAVGLDAHDVPGPHEAAPRVGQVLHPGEGADARLDHGSGAGLVHIPDAGHDARRRDLDDGGLVDVGRGGFHLFSGKRAGEKMRAPAEQSQAGSGGGRPLEEISAVQSTGHGIAPYERVRVHGKTRGVHEPRL